LLLAKNGKRIFKRLFDKYVYGTEDFDTPLSECFNYLEIDFIKTPSAVLVNLSMVLNS